MIGQRELHEAAAVVGRTRRPEDVGIDGDGMRAFFDAANFLEQDSAAPADLHGPSLAYGIALGVTAARTKEPC